MDPFTYILPSVLSLKKMRRNLPPEPQYRVSLEKGEKWEGTLLDTFENELLHSNKLLFQVGEMLYLADLHTGRIIQQNSTHEWSFASDLGEGPVTDTLRGVSKLRAFLFVANVKVRREHGLLLDDEGKTRARFHNLALSYGKRTVGMGSTHYLRGYGKAHADICISLAKLGAIECRDAGQVYDLLKIERQEYSAKPHIPLKPQAPVKESAATIIESFIRVARCNEDGVVEDYDTEFLHDYRVSFRKVRSVLSLFKGVYSLEDTVRLKDEFAELMQKTNRLRDLDVYLLTRRHYFSLVPPDTHEGLEILFDYFTGERTKEQQKVSRTLRSKQYQRKVKALEQLFANGSSLTVGPKGEEASLPFACGLILKRYGKVCRIARKIDNKTEDAVIHQLRINCKKLRYLMEFFSPLFPQSEMKSLVKALKVLQDNLGNFNDYSVQQLFLRQLLNDSMGAFRGHELKVAEGVGALTAMLNRLQLKERGQVMKNFARFDSSTTRDAFKKLFQTEDGVNENNSLL
jgi:CHAD domain-containing protein